MKIDFKAMMKTVATTFDAKKPEILTGAGLIFMVGATVATVVATVKTMNDAADKKQEALDEIAADAESYDELSDEEKQEYDEIANSPVSFKVIAPVAWKHWVVPFAAEVSAAGCFIASNRVSASRIGKLAASVAYYVAETTNLKNAAKEVIGEKKLEDIEKKAGENKSKLSLNDDGKPLAIIETGTGNELFYDYYGGRYFHSSMNFLERSINSLNFARGAEMTSDPFDQTYTTLNDFYDCIPNLDRIGMGSDYGWGPSSGPIELVMSDDNACRLADGTYYYVMRFKSGSSYGFQPLNDRI